MLLIAVSAISDPLHGSCVFIEQPVEIAVVFCGTRVTHVDGACRAETMDMQTTPWIVRVPSCARSGLNM